MDDLDDNRGLPANAFEDPVAARLLADNGVILNENAALRAALVAILDAEQNFRESMPKDWEGDPLTDACEAARKVLEGDLPSIGADESIADYLDKHLEEPK